MEPDFSGFATKADIKCSDGRTISPGAFEHQDGQKVPLVWSHQHSDVKNVLGHAILKQDGPDVRCDAFFNETERGKIAKALVEHGDVESLSIWANELIEKLVQGGKQVLHGAIKEVSLVLSGANSGAKIDYIRLQHGDDPDDFELIESSAVIHTGIQLEKFVLAHAGDKPAEEKKEVESEKTLDDIYHTLNDEQKDLFEVMIGEAMEAGSAEHTELNDDGTPVIKHDEVGPDGKPVIKTPEAAPAGDQIVHSNVFDNQEGNNMNSFEGSGGGSGTALAHGLKPEQLTALAHSVFADWEKPGQTFKTALLAHAGEYGVTNIEVLFPDAKAIDTRPEWITRKMDWVEKVLNGTRKLPYARWKSQSADLTQDSARAKGYDTPGALKKEQFFEIAGRETGPTTIYKKQKLDRDNIIDITDFDIVAWFWVEMRFMLREEIARAILIGDGREVDDPDKINESKVRPIAFDDAFYTDRVVVPASVSGVDLVESVIRNRETYLGEGLPTAFMTRSVLNDMLLAKDNLNRRLYRNRAELASELEVDEIVLVPVMAGAKHDLGDVLMILVDLSDYNVGTDKGGEITTFEDFDLDVNQHKYLIEGRMSGGLGKFKTAQVILRATGTLVTPGTPTFVNGTGVITIPNTAGVTYKNQSTQATLSAGAQSAIAVGATLSVVAVPNTGYYFPHNFDADWSFTRTP